MKSSVMKRTGERQLSVRRVDGVDFLKVPDENVLDLRVPHEETPKDPPRRPHARGGAVGKTAKFLLIAILISLPVIGTALWQHLRSIEGKVLGASADAYGTLREAGQAITDVDTALAERNFEKAAASFREARQTLDGFRFALNGLTETLPGVSKVKSGRALLAAGEALAQAGAEFSSIAEPLIAPEDDRTQDFAHTLALVQQKLPLALDHVDEAIQNLHKVSAKDVPDALRPQFVRIRETLPSMKDGIKKIRNSVNVLYEMVGGKRAQRYLVLFQNNLELRPTGGFIGSLALIDVTDGKVTKLEVPGGGAYDLKGQLTEKVIAPEPLHLVNPHWQLQDANWWPDFPTSAKKIMWFYEKSGGPTVDGVVALTPDVIMDLLEKSGPIDMQEQYGTNITSENLITETTQAKEDSPDRPKQIIADLVPRVLDRLFTDPSIDQLSVLAVLERAVGEKQLLLYFPERDREEAILTLGWGGAVAPGARDSLLVVDTNIGGGKTDGAIDERIGHEATIAADGSIVDTVTLTRTHHGTLGDQMTGVRNIDFVRFYVPKGSTLLSADGFERIDPKRFQAPEPDYKADPDIERIEGRPVIDELSQTRISDELGFTVFANWMGVGPGETATARITYRLPFQLEMGSSLFSGGSDDYSVLVQKQAGVSGRFLTSEIHFPPEWALTWVTPENSNTQQSHGLVQYSSPLDTDQLLGIILSTK